MGRAGRSRTSGGTGRRTGFRFRRRKACGFDSRLVHNSQKQAVPNETEFNGLVVSQPIDDKIGFTPLPSCDTAELVERALAAALEAAAVAGDMKTVALLAEELRARRTKQDHRGAEPPNCATHVRKD